MAEVDDVTLALLNEENCFLREKLEDLEKKYNSLIKKETVVKNTLQELQKQRNEAEKNYNRLQEGHAVSCTAAADKIKETEKKLQEINIKYETEVRTKTETEVSLQKKVIMVQDELNKEHKELIKAHKELIKAQREIISTQKEIINLHKELNNLQKQLYEKADQIRIIQAEQKDREEKLKKSIETQMINNQMVRMRAALTTFEKQKIPDFDPNKRGELWDKYLKTNYKNITLLPNVKGCVRSIFDKLNRNVHNCYYVGDEMIIQKSAFDDDELTLLEIVWQLSPLRKGSLSTKMPQGVQGQSQHIPESHTIWQGLLEWSEKTKYATDPQIIKKHVPFQVSAKSKDGEPELKAEGWPQTFIMQLMPKQLIGNIGGAYLMNSKSLVLFHPQPCEDLESLTSAMSSGFAGWVHFINSVPPCELKVLILLYNVDKKTFLGIIPNDQVALVDKLRLVMQQQILQPVTTTLGPTAAATPVKVPWYSFLDAIFSLATSINHSTTATNTSQMASLCTSVNNITTTSGPIAAASPAKVPRYDFSDASFSLATSVNHSTTATNISHMASLCTSVNTVTTMPEPIAAATSSSGKISIIEKVIEAGNVLLMEDEPSTSAPIPVELKMNPNINWDILSEVECPVCFDYMVAPIYLCTNGHSFCKPCKVQLTQCPTCRYKFLEAKNVVLDKIMQHIIYPCKFYKSGCQYSSKSIEIRNHENRCEFKPYNCPLKFEKICDWNGSYTEMVVHIDNNHDEAILKTDKIDLAFDENKPLKKYS